MSFATLTKTWLVRKAQYLLAASPKGDSSLQRETAQLAAAAAVAAAAAAAQRGQEIKAN
jgi:hypothetical protein